MSPIDFVLLKKRFINSCLSLKTYPEADIGSDHCLLVDVFKLKISKVKTKKSANYDLQRLTILENEEAAVKMLHANIQPNRR